MGKGGETFFRKFPLPSPIVLSASPRPAGSLNGGLAVAAGLVLLDGRSGGLADVAVGEGGGYGDALGAGIESGLDEPADFVAAESGAVRSEDDRDEPGVAAAHRGNDVVPGGGNPAGFQAVRAGARAQQGILVGRDRAAMLEDADAVVLVEGRGIVFQLDVAEAGHVAGGGVLPGGGQAVGRLEGA